MSYRYLPFLTLMMLLCTGCPDDPTPQATEAMPNMPVYMMYPTGGMTAPMGNVTPPPAGMMTPPPAGMMTPPPAGMMMPPPSGMMMPPPSGMMMPPAGGTNNPMGGTLSPVGGDDAGYDAGYYGGYDAGYYGGYEGGSWLDEECEPGEWLDVCAVCGDDGYPTMPLQDVDCPSAICPSEVYSYDNGLCERFEYVSPDIGYCEYIGSCWEQENQPCDIINSEVIAEDGVCSTVISCDGLAEPEIEPSFNGARCNEWGTCQNGACTVPYYCGNFVPYNNDIFFCNAVGNNPIDANQCAFFVTGTGISANGQTTCNDFCANSGAICVNGWNDNNTSCNPNNDQPSCERSLQSQICLCEF